MLGQREESMVLIKVRTDDTNGGFALCIRETDISTIAARPGKLLHISGFCPPPLPVKFKKLFHCVSKSLQGNGHQTDNHIIREGAQRERAKLLSRIKRHSQHLRRTSRYLTPIYTLYHIVAQSLL